MIRFFNGFLVLFWPERIFAERIKQQRLWPVIEDLLLTMTFISVSGLVMFKLGKVPSLRVTLTQGVFIIGAGWIAVFLAISLWAGVRDAGYVLALKINGTPFNSRFRQHWLCLAYIMPWGLFVMFLAIIRPLFGSAVWDVCLFVVCLVRLLDMDARLHAQAYEMTLRASYRLVLIEVVLFSCGILLGNSLSKFPSTRLSFPPPQIQGEQLPPPQKP